MSKRKQSSAADSGGEGTDSSDVSIIDVSFDFCTPTESDYTAFTRLFAQLFHYDAPSLPLSALTELVLAQPGIGTTVKSDDGDGDPYALLSVLNLQALGTQPAIQAIATYALERAAISSPSASHSAPTVPTLHDALTALFNQTQNHVGLVLCERLINMPVQIVPPMYRMLLEEMEQAVARNEPYNFTHYLVFSRTYHLSPDEESALANSAPNRRKRPSTNNSNGKSKKSAVGTAPGKKARLEDPENAQQPPPDGIYSFHPEDEVLKEAAEFTHDYAFARGQSIREKDAFGLDTRGRMMLLSAPRFIEAVRRMSEVFKVEDER